jgi:hypothetical protein
MVEILITVLCIKFSQIPNPYCNNGQFYILSSRIFIAEQTSVVSVHLYGNFHISPTKFNEFHKFTQLSVP